MLTHVKYTEIPVVDQNRALAFYTQKLGLKLVTDRPMSNNWRWIVLEIPGAPVQFLMAPRNGAPTGVPRLNLVSNNIEADVAELTGRGVVFTRAPGPAPWNAQLTYALCRDSEGNIILIGSG